jgi:hypothetical protein
LQREALDRGADSTKSAEPRKSPRGLEFSLLPGMLHGNIPGGKR